MIFDLGESRKPSLKPNGVISNWEDLSSVVRLRMNWIKKFSYDPPSQRTSAANLIEPMQ
jgi:hypothetical protein